MYVNCVFSSGILQESCQPKAHVCTSAHTLVGPDESLCVLGSDLLLSHTHPLPLHLLEVSRGHLA